MSSVPIRLFYLIFGFNFEIERDVTSLITQRERTKVKQISPGLNNSLGGEQRGLQNAQARAARNRALLWIIGSLRKTRDIRLLGKKFVCHAGSE